MVEKLIVAVEKLVAVVEKLVAAKQQCQFRFHLQMDSNFLVLYSNHKV